MELALILICAALILLWLLEKRKRAQEQKEEASNVEQYKGRFQKTFLMTLNEKSEYWKLKEVTDRLGLLLFAKVRMLDIVTPKEKKPVYLNKVIRKHLDFVILNKKGYTVCVIELGDNSHQAQSRQKVTGLRNSFFRMWEFL